MEIEIVKADLLYGVPAIAEHLGLRDSQIYNLVKRDRILTFKIGGRVCSRRSDINTWLAEQAAAAKEARDGQRS